jgi:hypothetical protein
MANKLTRHEPLTRENAVLLLVDHQVGLYTAFETSTRLSSGTTSWARPKHYML